MAMPTTGRVDLRSHAEEIVRAASRAPSHHNAQPWAFRVERAEVEVYADRGRRVPVADPDDRQLFIGLGAAVFGARLALSHLGVRSVVRLARSSTRPDLAAVVVAVGGQADLDGNDRLYAELDRRRTVRGSFTDDAVPVPVPVPVPIRGSSRCARGRTGGRTGCGRDRRCISCCWPRAPEVTPRRSSISRWRSRDFARVSDTSCGSTTTRRSSSASAGRVARCRRRLRADR